MAGGEPGATARAFHESTKHTWERLRRRGWFMDWDNKPAPFKGYEGLPRRPLPTEGLPAPDVPALEAIGAPEREEPADLHLPHLARLLVGGAGVRHTRTFAEGEVIHFRTFASAGALYPVEIYVACGDLPDLPAGVYHFDPSSPALVGLRDGDHRAPLVRAAAGEPAVAEASAILVLTGIPWRTAWKYTERGYRHLFWDAGMVLANLLALAASAGLPMRIVLGFADEEAEALLGLDGRSEFPLCLVSLGRGEPVAPAAEAARPASFTVPPLSRKEFVFEAVTSVNDAGRLPLGAVTAWREAGARIARTPGSPPPLPETAPGDTVEEVIRRRGSARWFAHGSIPETVLATVLDRAAAGIPTDLAPGGLGLLEPFLVANAVTGLGAGAYAFRQGRLVLLREGDFRQEAGALCLGQRLGADAAATHFLMVDLSRTLDALGDRGYRVAQLEAGVAAGRLYLGAYAFRFGASGLTFFDDDVTEFFAPDAQGLACMLAVALGESPRLGRGEPHARDARMA